MNIGLAELVPVVIAIVVAVWLGRRYGWVAGLLTIVGFVLGVLATALLPRSEIVGWVSPLVGLALGGMLGKKLRGAGGSAAAK